MEKVEVVVVGAGVAGLAAAMVLAEAGVEVLVVERGDYPGSKNVTGGRLYLEPVRPYLPDLWDEAPLERGVVKERLTMVSPSASTTVEVSSERFRQPHCPSYTLLHSTFDRWLADQAAERGAFIIPGYKVDDLLVEDGQVVGIVSAGDEIRADAVVAADGVLSFMAEKAGLRAKLEAKDYAVAAKEVVELPSRTIEERFGVEEGEGVAQLLFGSLTEGMFGGGFLYTNRESLSLGLVIAIHDLMAQDPPVSPHDLLEKFKSRPEIKPLIAGGNPVEYSAHIIPEGGFHALPRLVTDGLVVVGDAAGLALNMGITVRGLDFALASGVMAARTLLRARDQADFSGASLAHYETKLQDSFVWKDLQTFRNMPKFLSNPRIRNIYPPVVCDLLEQLLWIGEEPKEKLSATMLRSARQNLLGVDVLKDLLSLRTV
jgi:electron transfer flavoprotein-quinone oxidoreductase